MPNPQSNLLTGNKGDWSEIYVLFRLLGDGRIYAANEQMERIEDSYLPIVKIIREENAGEICEYICGKKIRITLNGEHKLSVSASTFTNNANFLLGSLQDREISKGKGSFSLEQTELFMNRILVHKIKAPSVALKQQFGGKADITMEIQDPNSGLHMPMAFSIKSDVAGKGSLGNASEATNFIPIIVI